MSSGSTHSDLSFDDAALIPDHSKHNLILRLPRQIKLHNGPSTAD